MITRTQPLLVRAGNAAQVRSFWTHVGGLRKPLVDAIPSTASKPILSRGGRNVLLGIAIGSVTAWTGMTVYTDLRQIRHMSSPEYRAPEQWNIATPGLSASANYRRRYEQAIHEVKMNIAQEVGDWAIGTGLLLGGYDRLWRVCEKVAGSLTASSGTIRGRMLSTTVFGTFLLLTFSASQLGVASLYRHYSGVETRSLMTGGKDVTLFALANYFHMEQKDEREAIETLTPWKFYGIVGVGLTGLLVGAHAAVSGLYERIARRKISPVIKVLAAVTGLGFLVLSVPRSTRPAEPIPLARYSEWIEAQGCIPLKSWSDPPGTKMDPDLWWRDIQTICGEAKVAEVLVVPDTRKKGERLAWLTRHIESPTGINTSEGLLICLKDWQLRELDHDQHLALLAESLFTEREPAQRSWTAFCLVTTILSFPLMHQLYVARPQLLLAFFPQLSSEALKHIPLAISLATTSALTEFTSLIFTWLNSEEADRVYAQDRRIAQAHWDCPSGLRKVLQQREQGTLAAAGKESMDWDLGTTDRFYNSGFAPMTTDRIAAIDRAM